MQVSLIMPIMNEVEGLKWIMPQIDPKWYDELIIMDGGSTDGSIEYCRENGYPIYQQQQRGLPAALAEAFHLSTKEMILTISPDGNCKPEHIPELIAKMREGYDMVIVSRYAGSATSDDDDFMTGLGNKGFTMAVNLLFRGHYTDVLGIYRAYRRENIERMKLATMQDSNWLRRKFRNMNSWDLGSSIRAAKLKLKTIDLAGDEPKRIGGDRKLSIWNNGLGALLMVVEEAILRWNVS